MNATLGLTNQMQRIVGAYIVFSLAFAQSSLLLYALFLMVVGYFALAFIVSGFDLRFHRKNIRAVDFVPLFFLLAWFYGAIVGLASDNAIQYIFSNFIGFITFFSYFLILRSNLSRNSILKLLLLSGVIVIAKNWIVALLFFVFNFNIYNEPLSYFFFGEYVGGSSTGQIRMLSTTQLVAFPVLTLSAARMSLGVKKTSFELNGWLGIASFRSALLAFILSAYVVIFMPASKGFVLASIVAIASILLLLKDRNFRGFNLKNFGISALLLLSLGSVLIASGYSNIIESIFASEDEGNITRYIQLYDLIEDIVPSGRGLGAVVPGNIRDEFRPYGFELSYINIIHKLGVVSVVVFFAYAFSLWIVLMSLKNKKANWQYSAAALGGICYIFPGIGNPIISSPQLILMHCISLYLIRESRHR
jgi:hypothetical protein